MNHLLTTDSPAVIDEGQLVTEGVRYGVVIDLTIYRQLRCALSREGHQPKDIVVPGKKMRACTRCGVRWTVS